MGRVKTKTVKKARSSRHVPPVCGCCRGFWRRVWRVWRRAFASWGCGASLRAAPAPPGAALAVLGAPTHARWRRGRRMRARGAARASGSMPLAVGCCGAAVAAAPEPLGGALARLRPLVAPGGVGGVACAPARRRCRRAWAVTLGLLAARRLARRRRGCCARLRRRRAHAQPTWRVGAPRGPPRVGPLRPSRRPVKTLAHGD